MSCACLQSLGNLLKSLLPLSGLNVPVPAVMVPLAMLGSNPRAANPSAQLAVTIKSLDLNLAASVVTAGNLARTTACSSSCPVGRLL